MNEMIERVAKAMRTADNCNGEEECGRCDDPTYMGCRALARVAIEAMREPTAGMVAASYRPDMSDPLEEQCWRAMIGAALQ